MGRREGCVMNIEKKYKYDEQDLYNKDFDDLVCEKRKGHMGQWEYNNLSMSLWNKFLKENYNYYYIPKNEIELIQKYSYLSSSLLVNEPVTLISRGPGTLFYKKEAEFLKSLRNIQSIVYIDSCQGALDVSYASGKKLYPQIQHHLIQNDFYEPTLRYPVSGIQINICFGLTFLNIEGDPEKEVPKERFIRKLKNIRRQMNDGDQLVTVLDHNEYANSIEKAYARQGAFAKTMLKKYGGIDPNAVDFCVKFFDDSRLLSHGFKFKRDYILHSSQGAKTFKKGDVLWFNNSFKPSLNQAKQWIEEAGFRYLLPNIPRDSQNRLGWHHIEAA